MAIGGAFSGNPAWFIVVGEDVKLANCMRHGDLVHPTGTEAGPAGQPRQLRRGKRILDTLGQT
jgi:hypothetical protein